MKRQQRSPRFGRTGRNSDVDGCRYRVIINPRKNWLPALQIQIHLRRIVNVVPSGGGGVGYEAVEVNSDVVVVYVAEFEVLDRVELDGEEVVRGIADVGGVEQAQVLAGKGDEVPVGGDRESEAVAAELWVLRDDGEDEGSGEGGDDSCWATGGLESKRGRVESVAE